jgi:hypothetical protein
MPTSFISIILFDKAFKYGSGAKFLGYVGTNTKPLCIKFYGFMQCHIFINCLTC